MCELPPVRLVKSETKATTVFSFRFLTSHEITWSVCSSFFRLLAPDFHRLPISLTNSPCNEEYHLVSATVGEE